MREIGLFKTILIISLLLIPFNHSYAEIIILSSCDNKKDGFLKNEYILDLKKSELKVKYVPYSADDSRALVQNRIGSRQKAEKELGFLYDDTLREGLQKLIDWRKSVGIDKA